MKVLSNITWVLIVLISAFGTGAFYLMGKKNHVFFSFDGYLEEFMITGASFLITTVLIGVVTLLIAKWFKAKNKFKVALITMSVVVAVFAVQAYFLVDTVKLIKVRAIYWEDHEKELIGSITNDLEGEGYETSKANKNANCIVDKVKFDYDFFRIMTDQQDMFMFLIDSPKYSEFKSYCENKKEMTVEEKAAFEKEMKELMGE